ncbi:MAG: hypothetical protein A07HR67_01114 [uncultured archaeon A07HR67]|nr:MAG: hypothetical protein A07HR67_01114 [uncultured archaeon A07HR67]
MRALLLLVVGIVGLIELLAPKLFVRVLTRVAYRNAGDAEPRPWVHTAARIEATVLLGVALGGLFRLGRSANDDQSAA